MVDLGTTVSLALICGTLLTVANVGDSEVFLDTFTDIEPMTACHKVETNLDEQDRLQRNGATISPFLSNGAAGYWVPHKGAQHEVFDLSERFFLALGPLRVWPGGIAISRSLGDFECSPQVIASPHITQVDLYGGQAVEFVLLGSAP